MNTAKALSRIAAVCGLSCALSSIGPAEASAQSDCEQCEWGGPGPGCTFCGPPYAGGGWMYCRGTCDGFCVVDYGCHLQMDDVDAADVAPDGTILKDASDESVPRQSFGESILISAYLPVTVDKVNVGTYRHDCAGRVVNRFYGAEAIRVLRERTFLIRI